MRYKYALLLWVMLLTGCHDAIIEYWNRDPDISDYNKAEEAYYAQETPQQKALRKKNNKICDDIAAKKYPYVEDGDFEVNSKQTDKRTPLYLDCMIEKGSPLFKWRSSSD